MENFIFCAVNWTSIQIFLENNIANQTLSSDKLQALLLSLKAQQKQDDSWFYY